MAFYCLGAECFITLYVIPCEQCSTWAMPSFISHGGSVEARTMKHELFQNRISKVHKVFFFTTAWNSMQNYLIIIRKELMIDV